MKTLFLLLFSVAFTAPVLATPPEAKPTSNACKANFKEWSQQKTETLTVTQINERMNTMFACAELSKNHKKQTRAYLEEFYRTHSELAKRAFDFITKHGLAEQFGAEENGISANQVPPSAGTREQ